MFGGCRPEKDLPLMQPHGENQRDSLTAALTHDFDLCHKVLMRDPLVAGRITNEQGEALLRDMLVNTKAYLPGWKL